MDEVRARIEEFGLKVHSIEGEQRVVIGAVGVGDAVTACLESLEAMPQVEKAVRISAPYKFVSKEFKKGKTEIKIGKVTVGGDEFVIMAGRARSKARSRFWSRRRSSRRTARSCCAAARSSLARRHTTSRAWPKKG